MNTEISHHRWDAYNANGDLLGTVVLLSCYGPDVDWDQAWFQAKDDWTSTSKLKLQNSELVVLPDAAGMPWLLMLATTDTN